MVTDMNSCDISTNMNNDLSSDPNLNYNILHDHITDLKKKHLSYKFEKFHKHKQNNNKWISFGLIRSTKTRDEMYLKLKDAIYNMLNMIHRKITFMSSIVFLKKPFARRKYNIIISYSNNIKAILKNMANHIRHHLQIEH